LRQTQKGRKKVSGTARAAPRAGCKKVAKMRKRYEKLSALREQYEPCRATRERNIIGKFAVARRNLLAHHEVRGSDEGVVLNLKKQAQRRLSMQITGGDCGVSRKFQRIYIIIKSVVQLS